MGSRIGSRMADSEHNTRMSWESTVAAGHEVQVVVPAPGREPVRVPIWVVAVGADLYVRSWKGADGVWYKRAKRYGTGTIVAGDAEHAVRFTPIGEPALEAAIDAAFRAKYGSSAYTEAMIGPPAAGTTMRLDRDPGAPPEAGSAGA